MEALMNSIIIRHITKSKTKLVRSLHSNGRKFQCHIFLFRTWSQIFENYLYVQDINLLHRYLQDIMINWCSWQNSMKIYKVVSMLYVWSCQCVVILNISRKAVFSEIILLLFSHDNLWVLPNNTWANWGNVHRDIWQWNHWRQKLIYFCILCW